MYTMISGITVGVILLQTIIFAPTIFTTIDAEPAGKLLRALFPKFFKFLDFGSSLLQAMLTAASTGSLCV